jgi:hypothetical protein
MDHIAAEEERWQKARQAAARLPPAVSRAVLAGLEALIEAAAQTSTGESAAGAERWAGAIARKVTRPL